MRNSLRYTGRKIPRFEEISGSRNPKDSNNQTVNSKRHTQRQFIVKLSNIKRGTERSKREK